MNEKIYGRKPVLEAIRSGARAITRIYLMQGSRDDILHQIEAHANARGIPLGFETRHRMDTMAGGANHQGVIAVAEAFHYADLEDIFQEAKSRQEPVFTLLLDEIEDPQNLGAIIRSADAAGAHGVVIPKHHAAEVNATVLKASAGAAEHVTTVKTTNLNDTIRKLKEAGVWVVGAAGEATKDFFEYDYRQPVALVIGNEGKGLRRLVRENCDELVKIPMAGKMSSLNASVAAALLLFEVARQRRWRKAGPSPAAPPSFAAPASNAPSAAELASYLGSSLPTAPLPDPPPASPPEGDFFRPGPDPAAQAPGEGPLEAIDLSPWEKLQDSLGDASDAPGNPKGGGFKW
ncbi:MAG TPA: 23S rRNA (guanosine(2251)-2'-O)-methyltransferase RlmB [bacterium]|nr:23S rRNA (guanosine(2251)-2'-O)-methyltransferase RlmB [bacterium]